MRYNIFFPNGINLDLLPNKGVKNDFLETLVSDKVVNNNDVLVSDFLQMVSMNLTKSELNALMLNKDIIIEKPQEIQLLGDTPLTINGQTGWTVPNEYSGLIGGVDYFYNNPDANPSTHNYFASVSGVTGEIIPTQVNHYGIDLLWNKGFKGQGINVAVIDTGCAIGQHPDCNIKGGVNVADSGQTYNDLNGHGTFGASVIGGIRNGSGVIGLAPECNVYSVKVVGSVGSSPIYGISDSLLAGLEWCYHNNIHVINISLQWGVFSSAGQLAINKLVNKNVIVCCAAGNSAFSLPHSSIVFPAGFNGTFAVGAKIGGLIFDRYEQLVYSNVLPPVSTGKVLDILIEPWIVGATIDGSYGKASVGTSQSTFIFSGMMAILRQRFPYHSIKQLRNFLNRRMITGTHGYKYLNNLNFIK